jgi:glycerophosphoryl diester phosphodiesterase
VQGFSAVLDNRNRTFLTMSDNGFGSLENSADYYLRVYIIRPKFVQVEQSGGLNSGSIQIEGYIELHDPDQHIPFAITNHFTQERVLTGADFDIESMQRTLDGTLWFGDEFGPFLLHTDAHGKVLEPPIPLPDFDNPGQEIRSPQNPFNEEASAVRIMNAVRAHAQMHGNHHAPVFSPWHVMLDDGNAAIFIANCAAPP